MTETPALNILLAIVTAVAIFGVVWGMAHCHNFGFFTYCSGGPTIVAK